MAWITNTVEDDLETLKEMFWPTQSEKDSFNRRNAEAKRWIEKFKHDEIKKGNHNSAVFSEMTELFMKSSNDGR